MALYAFDGTSNEDKPGEDQDTNVRKLFEACQSVYAGSGDCFYVEGVGTRHWLPGFILGGLFGIGGQERVGEAMDRLAENVDKGDTHIDIIGFSRGAALALEFANDVHDSAVAGQHERPIRFLGLWDTVASFGLPGNNINLGYTLTVPKNVTACYHAMSLDERRQTFPLTRAVQDRFSDRGDLEIQEVWFRGYHSDIGGGNKNLGLSNIALYWMFRRARAAGVTFDGDRVDAARDESDRTADGKTSLIDRYPNKKRTVQASDVVHHSVDRRARSGAFEANNPPRGLKVTNDDGAILSAGFEE